MCHGNENLRNKLTCTDLMKTEDHNDQLFLWESKQVVDKRPLLEGICFNPEKIKMELYKESIAVYYKDGLLELKLCRDSVSFIFGKVICNQMYGKNVKNVFQMKTYTTSTTEELITIKENCNGEERRLSDCSFTDVKMKCPKLESFEVQCKLCAFEDLMGSLNSLEIVGRRDEIHKSVSDAWLKLKELCGDGYCGEGSSSSQYCKVKAFLLDAIESTKPDLHNGIVLLQTSTNYAGMLKDHFMKEQFSEIKSNIFQLGDQVGDMQRKLSTYFTQIAEFDLKKANADQAYSTDTLANAFDSIKDKQSSIRDKMMVLAGLAGGVIGGNIVEKVIDLAIIVATQANPITWLQEDGTRIVQMKEIIVDIMKNTRDLIKLGILATKTLPELKELALKMENKLKENADTYSRIKILINPEKSKPFTIETSKTFLKEYNKYSPPITPGDLTKYGASLEQIVDFFCEKIEDTISAIGAAIGMGEAGDLTCYNTKTDIQVMMSHYEHIADLQLEVMESFAQMARAKVAAIGAKNLGEVLKSNLNDRLIRAITQWDILFRLRARKISIIRLACDQLAYMNGGKHSTLCENLLQNPDLDAFVLMNTDMREDKCKSPKKHIVTIPGGYIKKKCQLKNGMLDINGLFKRNSEGNIDGESEFHIPNRQWLVDNGWISDTEKNLLYFKKFQIFIPTVLDSHAKINIEAQVVDNTINRRSFMLKSGWKFTSEYSENAYQCESIQDNLYNFKGCGTQLNDLCSYSTGTIDGPFYPLLTASWKITLKSKKGLLPLYPGENTSVPIKAKIEYCSGTEIWPIMKTQNIKQK